MESIDARLASQNLHKLRELAATLTGWNLELLDADEFPAEDGETYYENAREKARFGRRTGASECWMLGEDSGIEVEALGGRPGIASARFAGPGADPVERLLRELQGIQGEARRARYVCELVCLSPGLEEFRGTGILEGRLAEEPRGSEGFGYDPIFIPRGETRTVAELGDEWKRASSHRAKAAKALRAAVRSSAG